MRELNENTRLCGMIIKHGYSKMPRWKCLAGRKFRQMPFPCPLQVHELNHHDRKVWGENGKKQNAGSEREAEISAQNKRKD